MSDEVGYLVVADMKENEDGSATYQIDMDDVSSKKVTEIGLEFLLTCAAYNLDIQEALQVIVDYGKEFGKELSEDDIVEGPYTAEEVGEILIDRQGE